jgi:hypothetical protein
MDGYRKTIVVLRAYLDESGIDRKSEFASLAGYCGGIGQWKRFEKKWKQILKKYGVVEFHARRFFGRAQGKRLDEYTSWTDSKADTFLGELLDCIVSVKIHPLSCVIVKSEWNKLTYGERRYITGAAIRHGKTLSSGAPKQPYFVLFGWCIFIACNMSPAAEKVHFAFDLNNDFHGYSKQYFKYLKNLPELSWASKLGDPTWPTSVDAVQLQAADLLAYLMLKFSPERLKDDNAKANWMLGKAVQRASSRKDMPWLGEKGMRLMLATCPPEERVMLEPKQGEPKIRERHLNGLA